METNWGTINLSEINWSRVIHLYFDKFERMSALYHLRNEIPKAKAIELFGDIWVQSESHYKDAVTIAGLLSFFGEDLEQMREIIMLPEEKQALKKLRINKKYIRIYRGCWGKNKLGYSWTLNSETAKWFAKRMAADGQPLIVTGKVKPKDIIAYFTRRDEEEIVVEPWKIVNKRDIKLPPQEVKPGALLFQMIQAGTFFTPEQEKEKFLFLARMQYDSAAKHAKDRVSFYKRFNFTSHYNLWNDINLELENIHAKSSDKATS